MPSSWLVIAVILSGLFFREVVSAGAPNAEDAPANALEIRRRVFFACFLIGPFAEAATGFGVGQVTTVAMLQAMGLPNLHVVLLGLFSQVLVSWGAMANGTVVGSGYCVEWGEGQRSGTGYDPLPWDGSIDNAGYVRRILQDNWPATDLPAVPSTNAQARWRWRFTTSPMAS